MRVLEVSLGDYVLNGGEVAALAMLEAVVRLLRGFMGNPESLVEESHESGLLEYPVYTRPPSWRGLEVPEVLLGGDHGAIERWRHAQSLARTAARRPDLLPPSALASIATVEDAEWRPATRADAGELLTLQRACWLQEALVLDTLEVPALHEDLDQVIADLDRWRTWVLRSAGRLVGSVRGQLGGEDGTTWVVGRLMVAPDLQGRGLGRWLLERCEEWAPDEARAFGLVTGGTSEDNQRMYRRAGYRPRGFTAGDPIMWMTKRRRRSGLD
jgi:tRNA (guanine37-N1)-methyltransferase